MKICVLIPHYNNLKGLEKSLASIARLDCGDLCYPQRFQLQREFLDKNPEYFLIGLWVKFVDLMGKKVFEFKPETLHERIIKNMPISNQFSPPAVMFRTKAIETVGYYPIDKKAAEDYAYFFQFVKTFSTANIPEVLVDCELNPNGISLSKRKQQIKSRIQIIIDNFCFSPYAFYGLIRNILLYFMPYKFIELIKSWIKK